MIRVVGFDADDTLWHNEHRYQDAKSWFAEHFGPESEATLARVFAGNVAVLGFGAKSLALVMIEAAIELCGGDLDQKIVSEIIERCRTILTAPVDLVDGAAEVVDELRGSHTVLLITKGDLADQWRKIELSGLAERFAATEIVVHKDTAAYEKVLRAHRVEADEFVMVGNSLASDIWPVLDVGAYAVHVPYVFTAAHEVAELPSAHERFIAVDGLRSVPEAIASFGRG